MISVESRRYIAKEAGVITPDIVAELKEYMLSEMGEELIEVLEATGLVKWHIDSAERTIEGQIVVDTGEEGVVYPLPI